MTLSKRNVTLMLCLGRSILYHGSVRAFSSRTISSCKKLHVNSPWIVNAMLNNHRFDGRLHQRPIYRLYATDDSQPAAETKEDLAMENLYYKWTLEDDQLLFENRKEPTVKLASMLGRGLRGVESRLKKLQDVNSAAYQRMFVERQKRDNDDGEDFDEKKKEKLIPASEVIRRIQWDYNLPSDDFFVLHYDRVDDKIMESPINAPNESISGKATSLVDALPEHRIVAIKYKERVVWDREKRMDLVFTNQAGGINRVIEGYDTWKARKDAVVALNRKRQAEVAQRLQQILGFERKEILKKLSQDLQTRVTEDPSLSIKIEAEKYVKEALELFRQVRNDPSDSLMPQWIPMSDYEALDSLSDLVSLLPDLNIRSIILTELEIAMKRVIGRKTPDVDPSLSTVQKRQLPELNEDEITETFIRGTGPGGQKINKTSNRVLLVHEPTQLRVECQDTRSLQQNRKIARKRLQQKLDEYLFGSQSKAAVQAKIASSKKAKAKARARARAKKRQEAKQGKNSSGDSDEEDWP